MNRPEYNDEGLLKSFNLGAKTLGPKRFFGMVAPQKVLSTAVGGKSSDKQGSLLAFRRGDASIVILNLRFSEVREIAIDFRTLGAPKRAGAWKPIPLVSGDGKTVLAVGNLECISWDYGGREKWRRNFSDKSSHTD